MTPEVVATYYKDPEERLDYSLDYTQWMASGDTITPSDPTASAWSIHSESPTGLTIDTQVISTSLLIASVFISGGRLGDSYVLTNKITTLQGRVKVASILIVIEER